MRFSSDSGVIHPKIAPDGTNDNLTRVQPDADLQVYAECVKRTFGMPLALLLHTQSWFAGARGMILGGDRSTKQSHDAIACCLVDSTLVVMNSFHHQPQDRLEKIAGLLGIAVGQQLRRSLEIGEQHGDL